MILLRVSFFNELENKNDSFESKALILRETPFDFIVGRKTIERYNLFDKIPSQSGNEIFSSVETKSSELVERPCDCRLKGICIVPLISLGVTELVIQGIPASLVEFTLICIIRVTKLTVTKISISLVRMSHISHVCLIVVNIIVSEIS